MSVVGVFQGYTDDRPQIGSTAIARGRLARIGGDGGEIEDPTGTFTLRRGATVVLNAVAMVAGDEDTYGPNRLICVIPASDMTRGQYSWDMILTDPATGFVSQRSGRFTL